MDLREENLQAQVEELVQFIEDKEIKDLNEPVHGRAKRVRRMVKRESFYSYSLVH